jgi:hypothetical protein
VLLRHPLQDAAGVLLQLMCALSVLQQLLQQQQHFIAGKTGRVPPELLFGPVVSSIQTICALM